MNKPLTVIAVILFIQPILYCGCKEKNKARTSQSSHAESSRASDTESDRAEIEGLEEDIESMVKAATGPDGLPRKTDLKLQSDRPAVNDMQKLRNLMQSFMNDAVKDQNDYIKELEEVGTHTLLIPARVAKDRGFKESRSILRKSKLAVSNAKTKNFRRLADFPKRLNDYDFRSTSDKKMLESYKTGLKKAIPLGKEIWELEMKTVEYMEDLIDILEASRSYWEVDQGMFAFSRERDLKRFNAIMTKISKCTERQTELKKESLKNATDKLQNIKSKIPN
jgi:hypothetical protein